MASAPALSCVLALAGRRIDAAGAREARFPLESVDAVRARIAALMEARGARALVCSAAAGADLLALDAALERLMRVRVVLPCEPVLFRRRSVADRPGEFGPVYDRILDRVRSSGDLMVVSTEGVAASYQACNETILDEAARLAHPHPPVAVSVWEGRSRGEDDSTAAFARSARGRGWTVVEIATVPT